MSKYSSEKTPKVEINGNHCVKNVQIRSFFWSVFGHFTQRVLKDTLKTSWNKNFEEFKEKCHNPDLVKLQTNVLRNIFIKFLSLSRLALAI